MVKQSIPCLHPAHSRASSRSGQGKGRQSGTGNVQSEFRLLRIFLSRETETKELEQNLTTLAPEHNLAAMLSAKLLPYLQSLSSSRRWSDEEVKEDAAFLRDQLQSLKKGLTCACPCLFFHPPLIF